MTVGLGVDIVEIERIARICARTPSFMRRAFTAEERAYCDAKANPVTHYAARFAAKEAVCKALGTGILAHGVRMTDVEVVRDSYGKPAVALHGAAERIARDKGVLEIPLSLSYTHNVVVANAVAITKDLQVEREKRRDAKAELARQFKDVRSLLDDLGEQTAAGVDARMVGQAEVERAFACEESA
ncbi:MAG: holo-ACP synthase [Slackia piriformis]|uniref:Holo-[acyl-carrier-protein] synthase n=1 Tax=Slackia piriformis TaxID=626934 RepID=A0A943UVH7_9ACTN|nr:holo-ACP synthase [Slackia piriformis]